MVKIAFIVMLAERAGHSDKIIKVIEHSKIKGYTSLYVVKICGEFG